MARLWCAGISCLLPQIPLQGPGVWFIGPRARALGGALQRWNRTLRNLRLGGHLPDPGRCGGGAASRVTVKDKGFLQRGWSQSFDIYTENSTFFVTQETQVVVRQEVERMAIFLVQQIQRERLWHVVFYGLHKKFSTLLPPKCPQALAGCWTWWG